MMISSDFRTEARKKLEGKWGKVALITFIYMLLFFVIAFIKRKLEGSAISTIFSLIVTIIEIPLAFGLIIALFKVFHDEEVRTFDFFNLGFSNFKKSWLISLNILLKMIIPVILIVVAQILAYWGLFGIFAAASGSHLFIARYFPYFIVISYVLFIVSIILAITKSYYYQLAYIVAVDNPELTAKEAVKKSASLMIGKRWKFFCLHFSFIGWAILSAITFGIGFIVLLPYVQFASIAFYKSLTDNTNVEAEVVTENNDNPIQGE